MGGGDGDLRLGGGFDDGLAHAAGFSSDEEVWHKKFQYFSFQYFSAYPVSPPRSCV
jgi:hypothetical protein